MQCWCCYCNLFRVSTMSSPSQSYFNRFLDCFLRSAGVVPSITYFTFLPWVRKSASSQLQTDVMGWLYIFLLQESPLDSIFLWTWSKNLKNLYVTAGLGGQLPGSKCQYNSPTEKATFFLLSGLLDQSELKKFDCEDRLEAQAPIHWSLNNSQPSSYWLYLRDHSKPPSDLVCTWPSQDNWFFFFRL